MVSKLPCSGLFAGHGFLDVLAGMLRLCRVVFVMVVPPVAISAGQHDVVPRLVFCKFEFWAI